MPFLLTHWSSRAALLHGLIVEQVSAAYDAHRHHVRKRTSRFNLRWDVFGEKTMGRPNIVRMDPGENLLDREPDFSLMLGGPLYQLYLRTRLARPVLQLVVRRMVDISLVCWLPLLLLAAAGGHLMGGVPVPFLRDVEVHIRFLLALPLLIAAEVLVQTRIRKIVPQFLTRDLVAHQDRGRFEELVASAMRLRNSIAAEAILLILVITV